MYIISGRGRKSGVARGTEATASLAPLNIFIIKLIYNLSICPLLVILDPKSERFLDQSRICLKKFESIFFQFRPQLLSRSRSSSEMRRPMIEHLSSRCCNLCDIPRVPFTINFFAGLGIIESGSGIRIVQRYFLDFWIRQT